MKLLVKANLKQAVEDSPRLMPRGPQRIRCKDLATLRSYMMNCGKKLRKMKDPGFSNAPLTKTYWVDGKTLVAEWDPVSKEGWFYGLNSKQASDGLNFVLYSPSTEKYYTGKAGEGWLGEKDEAFPYTQEGGERQAKKFNEGGFAVRDWQVVKIS
jgi:hypothetical protein